MNKTPLINRDYRHRQGDGRLRGLLSHRMGPVFLLGSCAAAAALALIPLLLPQDAAALRHEVASPEIDAALPAMVALPISLPAPSMGNSSEAAAAALGITAQPLANMHERAAAQILERLDPQLPGTESSETPSVGWEAVVVRRGDTLAGMLTKLGLEPRTAQDLLALGGSAKELKRIYPGDRLEVRKTAENALEALRYTFESSARILEIRLQNGKYDATLGDLPLERRVTAAAASIDSSLFVAGQQAGLSDALIMALANVFAWDVDFALDIRKGDHFAVLYEELYRDGQKLRDGTILAAEFTNDGRTYRAVRFEDQSGAASGYYSIDGQAMRKAFLRSPVEFTRISSTFSMGRRHPVLNRIRAHKGVDYAAPTGTPVKSTGDGKITFIGTKGGYGKAVVVQHGSQYSTLYAHLSRFARGVRAGARVKQGDVIGYVGQTGLATGPHLHYEFLVNGVHRNPLTVALPHANPLPIEHRPAFLTLAEQRLAELAQHPALRLASSGDSGDTARTRLTTASNQSLDPSDGDSQASATIVH